jgi:hypothetical protein
MRTFVVAICFLGVSMHTVSAQFGPLAPPVDKKKVSTRQTGPGLMSESTRPAGYQPAVTNADYWLSVVKVTISTGADNKEALSNVSIELGVRNTDFQIFSQNSVTNELKSNSTATIGLEKSKAFISASHPHAIPVIYYTSTTGPQAINLSAVERNGIGIRVVYKPNIFADAWKIENVSVTLEFRDEKGNLHPVSGQQSIKFSNANTFLDNFDKRILICTADGLFNPLTSFVTKDFSKRW